MIAILEPDFLVPNEALVRVVQIDAIGAGVRQEIAAILVMNGAVLTGEDAFRVLQDPVVLRGATDADRSAIQDFGGFLAWREPLIAGNRQFQGHGAISVDRDAASSDLGGMDQPRSVRIAAMITPVDTARIIMPNGLRLRLDSSRAP